MTLPSCLSYGLIAAIGAVPAYLGYQHYQKGEKKNAFVMVAAAVFLTASSCAVVTSYNDYIDLTNKIESYLPILNLTDRFLKRTENTLIIFNDAVNFMRGYR